MKVSRFSYCCFAGIVVDAVGRTYTNAIEAIHTSGRIDGVCGAFNTFGFTGSGTASTPVAMQFIDFDLEKSIF